MNSQRLCQSANEVSLGGFLIASPWDSSLAHIGACGSRYEHVGCCGSLQRVVAGKPLVLTAITKVFLLHLTC